MKRPRRSERAQFRFRSDTSIILSKLAERCGTTRTSIVERLIHDAWFDERFTPVDESDEEMIEQSRRT